MGFKLTVDASSFHRRAEAYQQRLREALTDAWPQIVQKCIQNILERTPDPTTEFRYIQGYEGGITFTGTRHRGASWRTARVGEKVGKLRRLGGPLKWRRTIYGEGVEEKLSGGSSPHRRIARHFRRKTTVGYRISFMREPGMWLENLIPHEDNQRSDGTGKNGKFFIGLGIVPFLEENSKFQWQNYSSRGPNVGEHIHTSPYGMWSFFEEGKSAQQEAAFGNRDYKLKPFADDREEYWYTHKFYPRKQMYSGFPPELFKDSIMEVIRNIPF